MQNETSKLNPLTCDLQVGDVVEVISGGNERAKIIEIDGVRLPYNVESEDGFRGWAQRDELRLISRNGNPVESEQHVEESKQKTENRAFVNVYDNGNGRFLSHDYASFDEAYENREDISTYIETIEIIRHKKPAPKIDFGKAGLVLTNGFVVWITTGEQTEECFFANAIHGSGIAGVQEIKKNRAWRDITAEAMPIVEQLKQLMK